MTTTTSFLPDGSVKVSLREPAQLIAAVPFLLGFRPADSLVILGHGGPAGKSIRPVLRLDLPSPALEREAVELMTESFARHPGKAVTILIVGRYPGHSPPPGRLPHTRLVKKLKAGFRGVGRPVDHAVWLPEFRGGARWKCYHQPPCTGVLPDEASTVLAAVAVSQGIVTFGSREEMERQLVADDPVAVKNRARLLDITPDLLDFGVDSERTLAERFAQVRAALDQVGRGELAFSDDQVVRLARALADERVRDGCLVTAVPAGSERSTQAERLWLELVRRVPAPERAEPAVLLAYAAFLRGDGTFASMALENAMEACPGHRLAGLLWRCIHLGVPPERLRNLGDPEDLAKLYPPGAPKSNGGGGP
jgi:Domain of unknown function (DUF4192)